MHLEPKSAASSGLRRLSTPSMSPGFLLLKVIPLLSLVSFVFLSCSAHTSLNPMLRIVDESQFIERSDVIVAATIESVSSGQDVSVRLFDKLLSVTALEVRFAVRKAFKDSPNASRVSIPMFGWSTFAPSIPCWQAVPLHGSDLLLFLRRSDSRLRPIFDVCYAALPVYTLSERKDRAGKNTVQDVRSRIADYLYHPENMSDGFSEWLAMAQRRPLIRVLGPLTVFLQLKSICDDDGSEAQGSACMALLQVPIFAYSTKIVRRFTDLAGDVTPLEASYLLDAESNFEAPIKQAGSMDAMDHWITTESRQIGFDANGEIAAILTYHDSPLVKARACELLRRKYQDRLPSAACKSKR